MRRETRGKGSERGTKKGREVERLEASYMTEKLLFLNQSSSSFTGQRRCPELERKGAKGRASRGRKESEFDEVLEAKRVLGKATGVLQKQKSEEES